MVKHSNQLKVIISFTFISLLTLSFAIETSAESNVLDQVVILETKDDYNKDESARMKERIGRIDSTIITALFDRGLQMKLINFPLTELPEYEFLKGQTPRGWEGTGKTWDDVPGAGANPAVARIGYSEPSEYHGTINLELHELAHLIDSHIFKAISSSSLFLEIQKEEQLNFLPTSYFNNEQEYFAESFSYFYLGGQRSSLLKQQAPKTYSFIAQLPAILSGETPTVEETTPPEITLKGENTIELNIDEEYKELGATATDSTDKDISNEIKITSDINIKIAGQYHVNYSVTDNADRQTTITRTINVIETIDDTTPPVLSLLGDSSIELNIGDLYEEYGATAQDNFDGDLTEAIEITGRVNTDTPGNYLITYTVTDNSGNKSSLKREINILDKTINEITTAPSITINGKNPIELDIGNVYEELGASAKDDVDGDLTDIVEITGNINTNKLGQYKIIYTVINNAGNTTTESRIVNIVESNELKNVTNENDVAEDDASEHDSNKVKITNNKEKEQVEKNNIEEEDEVVLVNKPQDNKKKPVKNNKKTETSDKVEPLDSLNTSGFVLPVTTSPVNLIFLMLVGLFLTLSGSSILLVRKTS